VLWIVVGLLLAAGVLAAALTAGDDRSPTQRLQAAPDAVADAGSFAFEITVKTTAGTTATDVTLVGAVDAETGRSTASFDLLGSPVELVTDGDVVYLRLPSGSGASGKPWVKVDAGAPTSGALGGITGSPLETFEQLRATGSKVEEIGSQDVRGVPTRHFRAVLDLSDDLDDLPQMPGVDLEAFRTQLSAVPVDVWLDEDDLVRRQRTSLRLGVPSGTGSTTSVVVTTTIEVFDYGKPVRIEVPAPDQVSPDDLPGLGGLFGPASSD
jgi:hypothetical protein